MTDEGPTVSAKQLAMSRALGAAFLSHQVEQLEKTVNARGASGVSTSWRDRKQATSKPNAGSGGGSHHYRDRPTLASQQQQQQQGKQAKKIPGAPLSTARSAPAAVGATMKRSMPPLRGRDSPVFSRKLSDERDRDRDKGGRNAGDKDVDIIVIDASVLVHALYQVKRWCRDGRDEVIIIPLEALNTLDLLKKGTTSHAQRARAASRILEAQVGTNPRIRVQRDEAFVYWDKITFTDDTPAPGSSPAAQQPLPSPEWVRRTVCCAKWTVDNSHVELGTAATNNASANANADGDDSADAITTRQHRVVLAVLSPTSPSQSQSSSPQSGPLKLSDGESASASAPAPGPVPTPVPIVPLPAAHPHSHGSKFEPRSAGTLVSHWASKAGIEVLEVDAAAPGHGRGAARARADEDQEDTRPSGGGKRGHFGNGHGHGHGGGRRKPSVGSLGVGGASAEPGVAKPNGHGHGYGHGQGLVERPPAVMAMMEMVSQPSKVVRVLARGEKLDP